MPTLCVFWKNRTSFEYFLHVKCLLIRPVSFTLIRAGVAVQGPLVSCIYEVVFLKSGQKSGGGFFDL